MGSGLRKSHSEARAEEEQQTMWGRIPWVCSGAQCTARSDTAAAEPVHAAAAPHQLGSPCTACLCNKTNRKQKRESKSVTVPGGSGNTFFQALRPGELPHCGELPGAQPLQHQGSVSELCEGEREVRKIYGRFGSASSHLITKNEEMPVAPAAVWSRSRNCSSSPVAWAAASCLCTAATCSVIGACEIQTTCFDCQTGF